MLKRYILAAVAVLSLAGPAVAQSIPSGLDLLVATPVATADGNRHVIIMYDRDSGKGGIGRADQYDWSRDLTQITPFFAKGKKYVMFYSRNRGEAVVHEIHRNGLGLGPRTHHHKGFRKTWDEIVSFGAGCVLFYSRQSGAAEIYRANRKSGGVGKRVYSSGWRKSWTHIVELGYKTVPYLLFYDRSRGEGQIHSMRGNCTFQKETYKSTRWRRSWTLISRAVGSKSSNEVLVFYDAGKGEGEIYGVKRGKLEKRRQSRTGWRKTWDDIIWRQQNNGSSNLLFYDRKTGATNIYQLERNGAVGRRLK